MKIDMMQPDWTQEQRVRHYKVIIAPTIYDLEARVLKYMESKASEDMAPLGGPEHFGHEQFAQTFYGYIKVGDKYK